MPKGLFAGKVLVADSAGAGSIGLASWCGPEQSPTSVEYLGRDQAAVDLAAPFSFGRRPAISLRP